MNRSFSRYAALWGALGCLYVQVAVGSDALDAWLNEAGLPVPIVRALQTRRVLDPQATQWLLDQDEKVHVLVEEPFAPETPPQIRQARRGLAETRARQGLLLYAAGEFYERQGFKNREAIAKALVRLEGTAEGRLLPGVQMRSAVLEQGAAAVAWTRSDRILAYRQQPPPLDRFLPAYCEALYPTAQALFQEKRHREALGLYQEMRALHCREPLAYFFDAAECFIAIGQPEDAGRLVNYVLDEALARLGRTEAERAGDLLWQVGDQAGAERAYQRALERLND